jgi:hypothetical protein
MIYPFKYSYFLAPYGCITAQQEHGEMASPLPQKPNNGNGACPRPKGKERFF